MWRCRSVRPRCTDDCLGLHERPSPQRVRRRVSSQRHANRDWHGRVLPTRATGSYALRVVQFAISLKFVLYVLRDDLPSRGRDREQPDEKMVAILEFDLKSLGRQSADEDMSPAQPSEFLPRYQSSLHRAAHTEAVWREGDARAEVRPADCAPNESGYDGRGNASPQCVVN